VIDEVHERSLETDVLCGFVRESLCDYPNLCVILMSATMDTERFRAYWGAATPHIHIPGRTFPVADYTLEDVLSLTGFIPRKKKKNGRKTFTHSNNDRPKKMSPWNDSELSDAEEGDEEEQPNNNACTRALTAASSSQHRIPLEVLVARVDETSADPDLILCLVKHIVTGKSSSDDGSILIFLPGAPEISNTLETIKRGTRDLALMLIPLHGGLQPKEQSRVFQRAPTGFTKVVLSTNVAETSITIPDCTVVIDW